MYSWDTDKHGDYSSLCTVETQISMAGIRRYASSDTQMSVVAMIMRLCRPTDKTQISMVAMIIAMYSWNTDKHGGYRYV